MLLRNPPFHSKITKLKLFCREMSANWRYIDGPLFDHCSCLENERLTNVCGIKITSRNKVSFEKSILFKCHCILQNALPLYWRRIMSVKRYDRSLAPVGDRTNHISRWKQCGRWQPDVKHWRMVHKCMHPSNLINV